MEKLSKSIATKLAADLDYDNDKKEVLAYGAFALIQMLVSVVLVMVFGYLFNVVIEALIISFTASILRKYSGGVHASSPNTCTFLGIVVCVGFGLIIKLLLAPLLITKVLIPMVIVVFMWSYYMLNKLAPVDTPNKPIKREEKRKRMKKGSLILLGAYFLVILINLIIYLTFSLNVFLVYSICIIFGILWQVFTLTKSGHKVIKKLDQFLNILLNITKEAN